MTDNNTDETDGQNSKLSRRTAMALMGASAVGGAAATSAFSQLTADRPIDLGVTTNSPDITVADTGSSGIEITNNSDSTADVEIDLIDDVGVINESGATVSKGSSSWEVSGIGAGGSATVEFLHTDTSNNATNYDFDATAFTNTSGYEINVAPQSTSVDSFVGSNAIHQYRIDAGSGDTLTDDVGSTDLTRADADSSNGDGDTPPQWKSDSTAGLTYLEFDGTDDYANGSVPFNNYSKFGFFVVFRTTTAPSASTGLMVWEQSAGYGEHRLRPQSDGTIRFEAGDSSASTLVDATSTTDITDGNWHTVFASVSETTGEVKIAIDGTYEATNTNFSSGGLGNIADNVNIGRHARTNDYFTGDVAFARIINGVPSASRLKELHDVLLG